MRVLLTGGAGFIGHHLVEHFLRKTNWELILLDRLDISGNLNRLNEVVQQYPKDIVSSRLKWVYHDFKAPISEKTAELIGGLDGILHVGASTHVDRSITHPLEFVYDNVVGTANMLEFMRQYAANVWMVYFSTDEVFGPAIGNVAYREWDRYNSGNPYAATKAGGEELCLAYANTYKLDICVSHCHDDQTEAMTEVGFKKFEDIKDTDRVWVLTDKGEMVLEPILKKISYRYNGKLVHIDAKKVNCAVTPEHRIFIRGRYEEKFSERKANELLVLDKRVYFPTVGRWYGKEEHFVDISQWLQCKYHTNSQNIPTTYKTKDLMQLIGWFVSEGCVTLHGIKIYQSNKAYGNEIRKLVDRIGIPHKKFKRGMGVGINSVKARDFFSQFGKLAWNKEIPNWVKEYSRENLEVLLLALVKGDGRFSWNRPYRYYTTSKKLADDVAEIAIKCGYSVAVKQKKLWSKEKQELHKCKIRSRRITYYVCMRKEINGAGIGKVHVSEKEYNGSVWCLTVPSGKFFIRRNGIVHVSGNCMNVFGERQHKEKFIPLVIRKVMDGEQITIHADSTRTKAGSRFYIHARNVADAVKFIIEKGKAREKYNIVGSKEVDNLTLAKMIAEVIGKPLKFEMVDFHSSRPGHDLRYALDGARLSGMGWQPPVDFEKSLTKTVEWTMKHKYWL